MFFFIRLNPQNTHQKPTVVVFCGPHIQGSYGVSCARHLANHNISTVVYTPPMTSHSRCALLEQEVALYDLSGCKRINSTDGKSIYPRGENISLGGDLMLASANFCLLG